MNDLELADLDDITPDEALLADVRRTRITTPVTRVLLSLIVIAAAFLGGALLERSQHKSSSSTSAQSLISQIRAAVGSSGASGASGASGSAGGGLASRFGGGGGGTFGTVKLVDGTNVYVQDAQGDVIKVTTTPSTSVTVTKAGKANDLAPGSSVIVQGKASADGSSMAATSISQSTGFGGGGGGRFGGGGGVGSGAAAAAAGG